ncbi:Putative Mce family protein [Mycobacteroides abscessus subsp. abscessus]|nr:Putative Mce family protein [Mycobacteroides abscessus subsp. abscessus]
MKRIVFLMAGLTAIVAVAVVLTLIIVNALRTPVNGPVRHYDALFTDASGLIVGNDVRISGVQVGKVEKIHLDGKNARITFNVLTDHPLYQNTTVAIRYQSLVGQRYVEIAQAPTPSAPLAAGTTIPLGQTIPSFDIAKLFNGFRPIFETLDPAQFNRLTENILQLIQGDERGIGPILRDIDAVLKLSVDRQAALQTIITNLGDISKDLGGTSDQLFYLHGFVDRGRQRFRPRHRIHQQTAGQPRLHGGSGQHGKSCRRAGFAIGSTEIGRRRVARQQRLAGSIDPVDHGSRRSFHLLLGQPRARV